MHHLLRPTLHNVLGGKRPATLVLATCILPAMLASVILACGEKYLHAFVLFPLLFLLALDSGRRKALRLKMGAALSGVASRAKRVASARKKSESQHGH